MGRGFRKFKNTFRKRGVEIEPDEIFLDSSNLPDFDRNQFEGKIETPIGKKTLQKLGVAFLIIFSAVLWKTWILQIEKGEAYALQSEINRLRHQLIFSERGVIHDRNGKELVWNIPSSEDSFARRKYIDSPGFAHLLGYVSYPLKDTSGVYYQTEFIGVEGVERQYDFILQGRNGLKIVESNALGRITSESSIRPPRDGVSMNLAVDAELQTKIHATIQKIATESGFDGGAAIIMDIQTGEILTMTSYPEYDSNILADGGPNEIIAEYVSNERTPFLNRVISGLYTPGSIVKPFLAVAALAENVIQPEKEILSTGSLVLPNPYSPGNPSIFRDWKAHGYVNMRDAIAVSSDVYFYQIGGGFEDQEGIGIENIEKYSRLFGLGELSRIDLPSETVGVIPNPDWKEENFPGDPWRVGNTYHTVIGQYGYQVTPIQAVRATAALARDGLLVEPSVRLGGNGKAPSSILLEKEYFQIAKEGMRQAVTDGTAQGIALRSVDIAAKTGTAEVGANKEYVNSWIVGFFPYEEPRYAFTILMEKAPSGTLIGSVAVAREMFLWMEENTPTYLGLPENTENSKVQQ